MTIKIYHDYELGNGLEYKDSKVSVKPDNTGNVQFEVTENGLKGNVELPAEFNAEELTQQITQLSNEKELLKQLLEEEQAKVATLEGKVQVLESREDIHITNAEVVEDTKLKITIQGAEPVTVDLAKFLNVVPTSEQVYADIKAQVLADVKAALKGEEVQDFAGTTKGYLITTA